jgi:hypothetical protein
MPMRKHGNKYWLREKEYRMLKGIYYSLYYPHSSAAESEIGRRLNFKFYDEFCGFFNTAPKRYRKLLNRRQRARSKQVLHRMLDGKEAIFEDNYKDCAWYW